MKVASLPPSAELVRAIRTGDLFVAVCSGAEIWNVCRGCESGAQFLASRGYVFRQIESCGIHDVKGHYFVLPVPDNATKATEMMWLRDHGIPFEIGKEWSPAEVFEYLRDLGLTKGGYWSAGNFFPDGFDVRWNK
jgi:hypothetical protein